jgi:uncharacterized protein (DUF488 family)
MAPAAAPPEPPGPTLYTIGHSNHTAEAFCALLRGHGIALVVDVRSRPFSRWPQFGRERLERLLEAQGIAYQWRGEALGGRPDDPALLDADGAPDYPAMAARPAFRSALAGLRALLAGPGRVAVLCSEGDPQRCHREHLIAAALRPQGMRVRHILRDGSLVEGDSAGTPAQLGLL